jgi:archaellum component FlaC
MPAGVLDPKAKDEYLKIAKEIEGVIGDLDKVKATVEKLDKNVETIEKAYE